MISNRKFFDKLKTNHQLHDRIFYTLSLSALAACIYFLGYSINSANKFCKKEFEESNRPIVGTVLEESYQKKLSSVPKWDGKVSYSNETVKLDSEYTLKIQTDDGRIIAVSIVNGGNVKKESLDAIIDKGTRIRFPAGNMMPGNTGLHYCLGGGPARYGETYFKPETQVGTKTADRIKVLPKSYF